MKTNSAKALMLTAASALLVASLLTACSSNSASTTSTTTSSTTTSAAATFQSLASLGQSVYVNSCSACHGASGGGGVGPALWGSGATLGTYNGTTLFAKNAQAMLTFISTAMPLSAPGSLSSTQYTDVLCYILVQGNEVSGSTTFDQSQLSSITLN